MSAQERASYQAIVDQTVDATFMKRYGTPDEQAATILFLASDEASYITDVTLPVADATPSVQGTASRASQRACQR
jgi:dihydroxycyclohexadiene carboxylate dehydrogenase